MVEITRTGRLHRGQRSPLNPNVLFLLTTHSRRLDHAKSAPSTRRPQGATEIIVGSTATTGPAGTATTASPRVATASAGSAVAEDAAASDVAAGDADAGDATGSAGAGPWATPNSWR
jgi:hypothetical protein